MPAMQLLGRIGLQGPDGQDVEPLLRQPKRLALLAYLASPEPGTWHRRDTVLALFWPELDTARGRTALRNALYVLRQNLAAGSIRTRGDDQISLDPERFTTDVGLFRAAIADGRPDDALPLFQGELLPGLFVPSAEGFEKWLDGERAQLRGLARRAALEVATAREGCGDPAGAAAATARALELDPDDEPTVRRLIALLDRSGDRAQALAAFDRFRERLAREFGAEPAPATLRLAAEIRGRRAVAEPAAEPPASTLSAAAEPGSDAEAAGPVAPAAATMASGAHPLGPRRSPLPRSLVAAAGVVALILLANAVLARGARPPGTVPREVLLAPMTNATGDPTLDYVATGLANDLATRLGAIGTLTIRSGATARWAPGTAHDLAQAGRAFGAEVVIDTRLTRNGDSLAIGATAIDVASGRRREASQVRFTEASLQDAGSRLAAEVAGTLFRVPLPAMPAAHPSSDDPESYRLTLEGWHRQLDGPRSLARSLFLRAIDRDPSNARAWSGLGSVWAAAAVTWQMPFDEAATRATAAAERAIALDSLQGSAWASLGIVRALRGHSLAEGEALIRKAIRVEPANPELYLVLQALYRHAWEWDKARDAVRVARALDPLATLYVEREGWIALCAGRDREALRVYRAAAALDSSDAGIQRGVIRSLSRLGRWDEALDAWRRFAARDSTMAPILADAHGEAGYWKAAEADGRRRLAPWLAAARSGWVSPSRLAILTIAAGDLDAGLTALEAAHASGDVGLYRLPCLDGVDRVRRDPRYLRVLAALAREHLR